MQTFDAVDRPSGYYPPVVPGVPAPGTTYTHDLDRKPVLTTRPDGVVVERVYDAAGRVDLVTTPSGTWDHEYFGLTPCAGCAPGKVARITSPFGVALDFTYDGRLVTSARWSGGVAGAVAWSYDADFREVAETVTVGGASSTVRRAHDADSLVVCASPSTCAPAGADALVVTWSTALARPERADLGATREA
ncbi:MAG: hypothetical protein IT376_03965 [Polyangiaceae bacterium]|nr:hypothetical protein [Polyangiaceae bacterium]